MLSPKMKTPLRVTIISLIKFQIRFTIGYKTPVDVESSLMAA